MLRLFTRKAATAGAPALADHAPAAAKAGKEAGADAAGFNMAKWYMDQALQFEKSKLESARRESRIAWRLGGACVAIGMVAILSATALVMFKRPNPPAILRHNTVTGQVDVLNVVADGRVSFGEKANRADLRRYLEMRESYDWENIQSMFDAVKLMSADKERDQYIRFFSLPNAPQKVLKDQVRIIARVGVITFVGSTAQVFFSKEIIPLTAGAARKPPQFWVATIAYRHDNLPEKGSELEINPTGFKVTSYTVDRDWSRSADVSPAQAGATAPTSSMGGAQ
ncbi:virB8 family protein [Cupriavidus sp. CP313]